MTVQLSSYLVGKRKLCGHAAGPGADGKHSDEAFWAAGNWSTMPMPTWDVPGAGPAESHSQTGDWMPECLERPSNPELPPVEPEQRVCPPGSVHL